MEYLVYLLTKKAVLGKLEIMIFTIAYTVFIKNAYEYAKEKVKSEIN